MPLTHSLTTPSWPTRTYVTLALVFSASYVILFATSDAMVNQYDEGLILTGALRVMNGELPSRDYYANYGPAQFTILGTLFSFFGPTLLVARAYDTLLAASAVTTAAAATAFTRSRIGYIACLIVVLAFIIIGRVPLYPLTPAISIVLFSCLFAIKGLSDGWLMKRYLGLATCVAGLMLFRYDLAVLALVALAVPVIGLTVCQVNSCFLSHRQAIGIMSRAFACISLAIATVLVILFIFGLLKPAVTDLTQYSLPNYQDTRALPFPRPPTALREAPRFFNVFFVAGATVCCSAVIALAYFTTINRKHLISDTHFVSIIVLGFVAAFCYLKGIVRPSPEHFLLANVTAAVAFSVALDFLVSLPICNASTIRKALHTALLFTLFAGSVGYLGLALRQNFYSHPVYRDCQPLTPRLSTSTLRPFTTRPEELWAAQYIAAHTKPTDRILSATGRHDKVFANNCSLYFVAQRLPCTRWHHYDPGVTNTVEVQKEIIRDIAAHKVDLIVRDTSWDTVMEPNRSCVSSGVLLLDEYIDQHFHKVAASGHIELWQKVGSGPECPGK